MRISNEFKQECKADVQNLKYGTVNIKNTSTDITESDDLQEFEINSSCYVNDKFIGTTVAKKSKVKLLNDGKYDLENKDIKIKTGIENQNNIEYLEDYSEGYETSEEYYNVQIKNLKDETIGEVKSTESETNIQQFVKDNIDKFTKKEVNLKTDENGNIYVTSVRNI